MWSTSAVTDIDFSQSSGEPPAAFSLSLLAAGCGRDGLGGCVCLAVRGVIRGDNVRSASTTPQANNMLTKSASHVSTARPGPPTHTNTLGFSRGLG